MRVLLGIVLGVVLVVAGGFLYFKLGYAPVATAAPPMPLEAFMARTALNARMAKEAPSTVPIQGDEPSLLAGARIYRESCAMCHGLRGQSETAIAQGMFPKPPQFLAHTGEDHPVGQTYWAVKNGIRLTGMPAFEGSLTEEQMWQVSVMLASEKLPDSVMAELKKPDPVAHP